MIFSEKLVLTLRDQGVLEAYFVPGMYLVVFNRKAFSPHDT